MIYGGEAGAVLVRAGGAFGVAGWVERGEVDVVAFVKLFQCAERAYLAAPVGRVEERGANPKDLHRVQRTPINAEDIK